MILTEEGYATLSGSTPTYYYYLKDHQGNNRVVINQSGTVEQVNHYYPFGGLFGEGLQTANQPYKYNGKELDRFQNLDMYDYGARHYDAAIGRWGAVDPLAESFYSVSPLVYTLNNPVRYIDKDGRIPLETIWDVANVSLGITSMVDNIRQGNYKAALVDAGGALVDVAAVIVPYVPGGVSTVIKTVRAADKVVDAAQTVKTFDNVANATNSVKKASSITENAAKGKVFENKIESALIGDKAKQITVEVADGTRTKIDFGQSYNGKITLIEAKSSSTATLTRNQQKAFPQIEKSGGTIIGKKGLDIQLSPGDKIPPTKVDIIRPDNLNKMNR